MKHRVPIFAGAALGAIAFGVWVTEASAFLTRPDSRCLGLSTRGALELVTKGLPDAERACMAGIPCVGTDELDDEKAALVALMNSSCGRVPPAANSGLCGDKAGVGIWSDCVAGAQVQGTEQIANALFGGGSGQAPGSAGRAFFSAFRRLLQ